MTAKLTPGTVGCQIMLDLSPAGIEDRETRFGQKFWQLRTPLTRYRHATGTPYGLDNGCFSGRLPNGWLTMLKESRDNPSLLWATSPDVVGSARRTLDLWPHFARAMQGIPRALVLQDGIGEFSIPWDELAAVFVGGTDDFKKSAEARHAVITAKMLGKWVHAGRVNTHDAAMYWGKWADSVDDAGLADSIDGSGMSRYDHMLKAVIAGLRGETQQMVMDLGVAK